MLKNYEEAQRILDLLIQNNGKIKMKFLGHTPQYARNYLRKLEMYGNIKKVGINSYEIISQKVLYQPSISMVLQELQKTKEENVRLKNKLKDILSIMQNANI